MWLLKREGELWTGVRFSCCFTESILFKLAPACWIVVGNECARTCVSKLTLNSSPETREGCRSAGNLCWLGTRVHPTRQKQPPAEQTRSGVITWRRRKKKTTHACNIMTDGWIMKRVSNKKKVRWREQAGNRADGNQTESDSTETTWLINERVFSCTPPRPPS